jgi:hypothetical protein
MMIEIEIFDRSLSMIVVFNIKLKIILISWGIPFFPSKTKF